MFVGSPLSPWTATILDRQDDVSLVTIVAMRQIAYSTAKKLGFGSSGFGYKISRPISLRRRSRDSTLSNAMGHERWTFESVRAIQFHSDVQIVAGLEGRSPGGS